MRRSILFFALMLVAGSAHAMEQFYKWRDANGVVHYTQDPPPKGVRSERLNIASGSRRSAEEPAPVVAAASTDTPTIAPEVVARRRAACETARANAATIEGNPTVTLINPDGTQRTLTAEEAQQQLEQARAQVTLFCSPAS